MPGRGIVAILLGVDAGADTLRARLEGRAEVLEITSIRYRALRGMLRSPLWRRRLRRNVELLHQMSLAQPLVDEVLEAAARRASAEAWPEHSPTTQTGRSVLGMREELRGLLERRLAGGWGEGTPLAELLERIEKLVAGSRHVAFARRWAAALEVLPRSLPELLKATERCDALERLLKRPLEFDGPMPFSPEEMEALLRALPEAEAALEPVWRRVVAFDPSGGIERELRERARRAPTHEPRNGAEALLRAAFWADYARSTLRQLVAPRVAPLALDDGELLDVARWLAAREKDASARLEATSALDDARAGLVELACELNRAARAGSRARTRAKREIAWEALSR